MEAMSLLNLLVLIAVVYLAFRVGAFLMKVLLGLLALALIVWLVVGLFGAGDVATAVAAPMTG